MRRANYFERLRIYGTIGNNMQWVSLYPPHINWFIEWLVTCRMNRVELLLFGGQIGEEEGNGKIRKEETQLLEGNVEMSNESAPFGFPGRDKRKKKKTFQCKCKKNI